jgi:hypothetical protein
VCCRSLVKVEEGSGAGAARCKQLAERALAVAYWAHKDADEAVKDQLDELIALARSVSAVRCSGY